MKRPAEQGIVGISAVTLRTRDMERAVSFYRSLGFRLRYGGEQATFTSFHAGTGYLNLSAGPTTRGERGWGRVIFHVADVDALYQRILKLGFTPDAPPSNANWGERYFHLKDSDGNELSFAMPLA